MTMKSGPFWLDASAAGSRPIDHLGLRQPGLQMANAIFPGFTNTTRRARNYSIIAWIVTRAQNQGHLRRLETAVVHAARSHEHGDANRAVGVIGARSVPGGDSGSESLLEFDKRLPSVLQPANYGPSARYLGLLDPRSAQPRPTQRARALAEAIGIPDWAVPSHDAPTLSAAARKEIGRLCPCTDPAPGERDLLEAMLLPAPHDTRGDFAQWDLRRRRGLALMLHEVKCGRRERLPILQNYVDWITGRPAEAPPSELADEAWGFGVLSLRWFFRHALESVWGAFGRLVAQRQPMPATRAYVVRSALAAADSSSLWAPGATMDPRAAAAALRDLRAAETEGHELINARMPENPALAMLAAATQLALVCTSVTQLNQQGRFYERFLDLGDEERVSLMALCRVLENAPTMAAWLEVLVERFAVSQHLIFAARKWATGVDGYYFHETDAGFVLHRRENEWFADAGQAKVMAAMSLLTDIGLVAHGDAVGLTGRGEVVLTGVLRDPGVRTRA